MAIINYSDLIKDDGAFDKLEREILDLERFLIKEKEKLKGALSVVQPNDSEAVKKYAQAVKELQKSEAKYLKLKEKVGQAKKKNTELTKKERIEIQKVREANRKANAEAKLVVKINNSQKDSIENLRAKLSLVTIAWAKLTEAETKNTKRGRRLVESKKKLTQQLKRTEQATDDYRRSVGKYKNGFKGAIGGLKNFAGALGITVGITALISVVKDSIKIFADFEQANANLSAILGKTSDQITDLTEDSKRLGSTTKFTASEVAGLQTEFAKLGFDSSEIINATEATLNLASATGIDLAQSAKQVGSAIRAFNLETTEATRVADVFALATSKSALDMAFLGTAMSTVAPVAKKFGFGIEPTTALLGKLADAGFDASSSATATRNIMLTLADSSSKLAQSLNEPVTDLPSLVKGLNQLKNEGVDLAKALELTDKRSVAAFSTFLDGADGIQDLSDALSDSGGTAEKMADTQLDTLSGSMTKLGSAWEGFILSMEDGTGVFSEFLVQVIEGAITLLSLASGIQQTDDALRNLPWGDTIVNIKNFGKVWGKSLDSLADFRIAMKSTVDVLTSIITFGYIQNVSDDFLGLKEAVRELSAEQRLNLQIQKRSLDEGKKIISQNREELSDVQVLVDALGDENLTREEKNEVIAKLNADYPELLENIDLETAGTEVLIELKKALIREILNEAIERKKLLKQQQIADKIIDLQIKQIGLSEKGKQAVQGEIDLYSSSLGLIDEVANKVSGGVEGVVNEMDFSEPFREQNELITDLTNRINALKESLVGQTDDTIIDKTNKQISDLTGKLNNANKIRTKMLDDALDKVPSTDIGFTTSLNGKKSSKNKGIDKQFKEDLDGLKKIFEEFSEVIIVDVELTSPEQFQDQIALINGVFEQMEEQYKNDKVKRLEIERTKLHLLSEANQNYLDELDRREQERIKKVRDVATLEVDIQRLKNDTLLIEAENAISESNSLISDLTKQYSEANTKAEKDELKKRIEGEIKYQNDLLIAKNDIRKQQIIDDADFRSRKAKEDIKDADLLALELEKIELKKNNDILKLDSDLNKQLKNNDNKRVLDSIENWKQFSDRLNEVLSLLADKIEQLAQKEVEQTKVKLDEQSDLVDKARDRAEKGLTNNLVFEQKEQAKREKELILAQKRLERIQKAKALYESYSANSSNPNVQNALAKTLRDFAILEAFTKGFKDGGYTGDGGVNELVGGVHGKEFVVDAPMTRELGLKGDSMSDFKNKFINGGSWALKQSKGSLDPNSLIDQKNRFEKKVAVTKVDTSNLEREIRELKEWQMDNPIQTIDVRKLTDNILEFVETTKVAGKVDIKRYRVKKRKF